MQSLGNYQAVIRQSKTNSGALNRKNWFPFMYKNKNLKKNPTPGFEPGPAGWMAAIMTTRPGCLWCRMKKIDIIYYIFSHSISPKIGFYKSTLSLEQTRHNGVKPFLLCCQIPTSYCLHICLLTYYTNCSQILCLKSAAHGK